jgi:hypothetical protein
MSLSLDVDGTVVKEPDLEAIAKGFASINPRVRALSLVILKKDAVSLMAGGHPKEGYVLTIEDRRVRKITSLNKLVPHRETIGAFRDFARGDDSWQQRFAWSEELQDRETLGTIYKRVAVYILVFVVLVLILRYVFKLF